MDIFNSNNVSIADLLILARPNIKACTNSWNSYCLFIKVYLIACLKINPALKTIK